MNIPERMREKTLEDCYTQTAGGKWDWKGEMIPWDEAISITEEAVKDATPKWISVKERLPEEDGEYLVRLFHICMTPYYSYAVLKGKKYTLETRGNIYPNFGWSGTHSELKVTHWQPLPSTPSQQEGEG